MWNDDTVAALDSWIGPSWRKDRHPVDDAVFFRFVLAVWDETHSLWPPSTVREFIRKRMLDIHPNLSDDFLVNFVDRNIERGTAILDFLCSVEESGRTL